MKPKNLTSHIKALDQAKGYADKLKTPIIATDGYRLKTWHMKFNQPLFNDEKEIEELFDIEKTAYFIHNNIYKSYDGQSDVKQSDLIKKFKSANNILKNEGLSAGIERFRICKFDVFKNANGRRQGNCRL